MPFDASDQLREKAHRLIPGGCHTYAKGDDQFPQLAPGFMTRGLGCHVWDVDGNEFTEYGMGLRSVTLGHAFPRVVDAARRELEHGSNFSRPARIEIECAETLLDMIPGAEMAKFCKDGSSATAGAIKLARAYTGRDCVACCRQHPFFGTHDWFMGTTPLDAGIPQAVKDLTLRFDYDDIDSVHALFDEHPGRIACLIMEPAKYQDPKPGFLEAVRDACHANGALFILDEMITGFRWHNGGGQAYYDVDPDLSCFGKAMANGFSVSALVGKREFMRRGGLDHEHERVFLLSTTHGAETHALAAAIATMQVYRDEPVIAHLDRQGERLRAGAERVVRDHGLSDQVPIIGKPCCLVFGSRDAAGQPSQALRTLLLQELIRRGVLATSFIVSYSHTDEDIDRTLEALDGALDVYRQALERGTDDLLHGPPSQVVYRRYNTPEAPHRAS